MASNMGIVFVIFAILLCCAAAPAQCGTKSKDNHPVSEVTQTNLRDMAKELFGKPTSLSSRSVVEKLEILKKHAREEGLDLPMDASKLLSFNEPLKSNCEHLDYIDELLDTLSSVKFSHKALVHYLESCIERQMAVCHFSERVIKSLDGYEQSTGWRILKNFRLYAKKYGRKLVEPGRGLYKYALNTGAMNKALEEMSTKLAKSLKDNSIGPHELAGQLRSVCDQLFDREDLLRLSLRDPNARGDKQAKTLHKYLGLCQAAAGANFGGL